MVGNVFGDWRRVMGVMGVMKIDTYLALG